jgi:membrane-bound lytic murein transglycosylase A
MRFALWSVIAALTLAGCAARVVPPSASVSPKIAPAKPIAPEVAATVPGPTARSTGFLAGPDIATLPISDEAAKRALTAFRASCIALLRRTDGSGLTRVPDWQAACDSARTARDAIGFFRSQFETVQVGAGTAFATGYYEPEITGSRTQSATYPVPIYGVPKDLIDVDLGRFSEALKGKKIRGRVDGSTLVPYFDRAEIEEGALAGRGLEIAWAADAIEVFFLQVQGSGRLKLPDGSVMRIGYAGQNGRDYTGIGKLMKDRGLLEGRPTSMQGLVAWLREHPEQGRAIMRENKSFVFFHELTGSGPLGALNVAVVARASVAADPAFVPLGAPVFLSMDRADATGLWVAQDTGGAIKGANRFDTFWGAGEAAAQIAGGMSARGTAFLLLPKGTLVRLATEGGARGGPTP